MYPQKKSFLQEEEGGYNNCTIGWISIVNNSLSYGVCFTKYYANTLNSEMFTKISIENKKIILFLINCYISVNLTYIIHNC